MRRCFAHVVPACQEYHGKGLDLLLMANTLNDKTSPDATVHYKSKNTVLNVNSAKYSRMVHNL